MVITKFKAEDPAEAGNLKRSWRLRSVGKKTYPSGWKKTLPHGTLPLHRTSGRETEVLDSDNLDGPQRMISAWILCPYKGGWATKPRFTLIDGFASKKKMYAACSTCPNHSKWFHQIKLCNLTTGSTTASSQAPAWFIKGDKRGGPEVIKFHLLQVDKTLAVASRVLALNHPFLGQSTLDLCETAGVWDTAGLCFRAIKCLTPKIDQEK